MPQPPRSDRAEKSAASQTKRRDIQGLRALAVLAVLGDHVLGYPTGGFVGVDVFFGISGYLISSHLLKEVQRTGRIDLLAFSGRRIRRLAPVALIVLATTVGVVFATFPPGRISAIVTDASWAVLAAANFRFIDVGTDYFHADGPTSPFQHFWSLAVEEQFYVALPVIMVTLALLLGSKRTTRVYSIVFAVVVGAAAVASFVIALALTASAPTVAYFSIATRAWELAAGALLAVFLGHARPLRELPGRIVASIGLAIIIASVCFVGASAGFPAPWALAPVLGAMMVILGGTTERQHHPAVLSNPVAQYLGDVSYSLYLWHFPVLIIIGQLAPGSELLTFPISFALAVSSFHLIERPLQSAPWKLGRRAFRDGSWRRWVTKQRVEARFGAMATLATVTLLLGSMAAYETRPTGDGLQADASPDFAVGTEHGSEKSARGDGYGPELTKLREEVAQAVKAAAWPELSPPIDDYLDGQAPEGPRKRCMQLAEKMPKSGCEFGPADAAHTAVLIGDSTAAFELDALAPFFEAPGSTWKLQVRSALACMFMDYEVTTSCTEYREETMRWVERAHPDLAIITSTYIALPVRQGEKKVLSNDEVQEKLSPYVKRVAAGSGKVALLAPPPTNTRGGVSDCYRPDGAPVSCLSPVDRPWRERAEMERALAEEIGGAWVNSSDATCIDGRCPLFAGSNLVLNDTVHYSAAFAARLAPVYEEMLRAEKLFEIDADLREDDGTA